MLRQLFRPRRARVSGQQLYAALVAQARRPGLYARLGAPDRIDARFELYTLHLALLLGRLKGQGEAAAETAQALFDAFIGALDDALRELGVGDLSVAKKMRKLGESLYGRMNAYEEPLRERDVDRLAVALARNVYESEEPAVARALAVYAAASVQGLADQNLASVTKAPAWAEMTQ